MVRIYVEYSRGLSGDILRILKQNIQRFVAKRLLDRYLFDDSTQLISSTELRFRERNPFDETKFAFEIIIFLPYMVTDIAKDGDMLRESAKYIARDFHDETPGGAGNFSVTIYTIPAAGYFSIL